MALLWLPDARRVVHDRGLEFTDAGEPKGVLHTTETTGRPSYAGWTVHPHLTVVPVRGTRVDVDQHIPFSHGGMALRNLPGGVQTNRDRAYQVELVGTCERGGPGYYWAEADDTVLLSLFDKVVHPMTLGLGIPLHAPAFQAYPASYGDRRPDGRSNTVRLSGPEWDAYSGWCGHQHVPENIHGDPGAFPWARMLRLAEAAGRIDRGAPRPPAPKPAPKPAPPTFTLGRVLEVKRIRYMRGADVTAVQRALGFKGADVNGKYGPGTAAAVRRVQLKHRVPDDGKVGPRTVPLLGGRWVG